MAGPVRTTPRDIANRVRMLIANKDQGDLSAAAMRLELSMDEVQRLDEVLARDPPTRRAGLLASVIRTYQADACWLLTGQETASITDLPPEIRLEVAHLLSEIGSRILAHYRESQPPSSPPA